MIFLWGLGHGDVGFVRTCVAFGRFAKLFYEQPKKARLYLTLLTPLFNDCSARRTEPD